MGTDPSDAQNGLKEIFEITAKIALGVYHGGESDAPADGKSQKKGVFSKLFKKDKKEKKEKKDKK